MKTFADVRRRIAPGARLVCVENTNRPELKDGLRIVQRVQTNAFTWKGPADTRESWTYFPKAKAVTIVDGDTFRMPITDAYSRPIGEHTVTLRFVS